ncbi:MAG: hydrogenase expression/formation protein HypE [Labilithrix sp.]|nr:hydrogenase expression/formation protein HypE [Labilithrix sp.]
MTGRASNGVLAPTTPRAGEPLLSRVERVRRREGRVRTEHVTLAHGGGGKAMRDLIDDVILGELGQRDHGELEDQARTPLEELSSRGDRLAFTTDSYVVTPLFFPGGDIGRLAVNGTVNDLAVSGAIPLHLSLGLILEEGLPIDDLRRVMRSVRAAAEIARVRIVTGDTKVVARGAADKLFINTSGVGVMRRGISPSIRGACPGDYVITNGFIGDHGAAILAARGELALETTVESDTRALGGLIGELVGACEVHAMRDATRGGLATVLNELALGSDVHVYVDERAVPVRDEVRGMCELLGLDPLYLANEGNVVFVVAEDSVTRAMELLRAHPHGAGAAVLGRVSASPEGMVTLRTQLGGERVLDMLVGDQLPRIC